MISRGHLSGRERTLYLYTKELPILTIRLPEDIERRLAALAEATGRTKTFHVREAILGYLDDLEDIYLGDRALEDIRAGRVKTTSLDEVMREHGLEH